MRRKTRACAVVVGLLALSGLGCSSKVERVEVDAEAAAVPVEAIAVAATDWPYWRGPSRNGIVANRELPTNWEPGQNILWKTAVPGRSHSSPTIVGNQIFLATADESQQTQSMLCLNRTTGEQAWQTEIHRQGFEKKVHAKNTQATCTLACDGQRVFGVFLKDAEIWCTALDLEGEELWKTKVGPFVSNFGYAPSPTLYKSFVILAADNEGGGYLAALHRKTGKLIWRNQRPAVPTYSSPVIANVAGEDQLLISGCELVSSFNPENGNENWSVAGTASATCSTMVWSGDLVIATGGYPGSETICIRADGSGDVVWRNRSKCYEPSMIVVDGHLYAVVTPGIAMCWDVNTGEEQWKKRLKGPFSASPICANGLIYQANETGLMYVFRATPDQFEMVAENQLEDEAFASPAVAGNQLFLRVAQNSSNTRQEYVYCIGTPPATTD